MGYVSELLQTFVEGLVVQESTEKDQDLLARATASNLKTSEAIGCTIEPILIHDTDKIKITVVIGDSDPISYYSGGENWYDFTTALVKEAGFHDNEPIMIEVVIDKAQGSAAISIYDIDLFASTIEKLSVAQGLSVFDRVLADRDHRCFQVLGLSTKFATSALSFLPLGVPCILDGRATGRSASIAQNRCANSKRKGSVVCYQRISRLLKVGARTLISSPPSEPLS
ncbi:MAG: hypothetical protein IPN44_00145 [Flavobacteriales bacterium]|nr:hypothetical protein [Flavobacteriales bacterium]